MSESDKRRTSRGIGALALGAATLALLSACGEPSARPMDDEFAGNSGESAQSESTQSNTGGARDTAGRSPDASQDPQSFADGEYAAIGQYGPVGEDTIDVYVGVKGGTVESVRVEGHPFTSISRGHQEAFAKSIPNEVVGKPLAGLKVDKVAGASWTSDAFNAALDEVRRQAGK
ncbi:MAG: FMN-binding protein [Bifidobacterium animalis]|nr:FMN-binding protein [Bifidobacterium animalis]MDY5040435.1 FMN-binding protein [Bifidobacterium animalis]RYN12016.1 FMN-binding protein [Bifidobacterium animalis subsp. animalis]